MFIGKNKYTAGNSLSGFSMSEEAKVNVPLAVFFIVMQVIVVAIIVALIPVDGKSETLSAGERSSLQIDVIDGDNFDWIDEGNQEYLRRVLFEKIKMNVKNINLESMKAEIYDKNVENFVLDETNSKLISAMVNLPELEQTYQLFYIDTDVEIDMGKNIYVLCPGEEKEGRHQCVDVEEDEKERVMIVATVIEGIDFDDFWVNVDEDLKRVRINVLPTIEVNDEVRSRYISEVKRAIEDLGISSEMFEYRVMTPDDYVDDPDGDEIYGG